MQPQMAACLCLAKDGTSIINEGIWENRYRYVDEFKRMGAEIQVDGKVAVVEGVGHLTGAPLRACDLRAGAAMVIAGLAASGTTEISWYPLYRAWIRELGRQASGGWRRYSNRQYSRGRRGAGCRLTPA